MEMPGEYPPLRGNESPLLLIGNCSDNEPVYGLAFVGYVPPNKSRHNSQRDIRCQAEYDDRNLVLCDVLKIRTGQVGSFQPKHPAMYPGYRPTYRNHHDRRNEQQHEIDYSRPTEKCGNCF